MRLPIQQFAGIAPKINPRYLPDSGAQEAYDVEALGQSLRPMKDVGQTIVTLAKPGTIQTIYRFGQDETDTAKYWLHWAADVDVCRGQIAADEHEWTFYTGDGYPKATNTRLALTGTGTAYPLGHVRLGLPAPTVQPVLVKDPDPDPLPVGVTKETRVYVYTWVSNVDGFSVESAPSPASDSIDVYPGQAVWVGGWFDTIPTTADGYEVTEIRLYHSVGTSGAYLLAGYYKLVADAWVIDANYWVDNATWDDKQRWEEIVNRAAWVIDKGIWTDAEHWDDTQIWAEHNTQWYDDTPNALLGEIIPSATWAQAPADLKGLINLPNGMMAGFVGKDVYVCDPYHPYAWPEGNINTVDYPVVGLGRMDTTVAVLTKGTPYFLQGSSPDNMVLVQSDLEQACVAKRSIVSLSGTVIYASPDGLVMLSPGGSQLLTKDLFRRTDWQALNPSSIHAYGHDTRYLAFYTLLDGTQGGFMVDLAQAQFVLHRFEASAGFSDLRNDALYLVKSTNQLVEWAQGVNRTGLWKSKKFSMPEVQSFSCAQVEAEAYPVTVRVYVDAVLLYQASVSGRDPVRLPAKRGRDWEIEVETPHEVFLVALAQSMDELADV